MHKKIELAVKTLIAASFVVPLVVVPSSYIFPFIVPKILLFRTMVLLMLCGCLILYASNRKKYSTKLTPINIVVGLFFVSFAVSTFVGVDWYRSFWDNHERMLGLFTIFHYVVYYFVVVSVVREWRDWRWLPRLFVLAGTMVMVFGAWQKFVDPDIFLNQSSKRVSATLGNAIYFSGYGLFLLFLGGLLAFKEKKFTYWWYLAVIGAAFGFLGIFLGGTRGSFLGLVGGVGILLLTYIFTLKGQKKLKAGIVGLGVLALIGGGLLFIYRDTDFVESIPIINRMVDISFTGGTVETRLMAWGIAVDAWFDKPVFGWGPNNYYYAFNQYYLPEFLEHGYQETWFDNAHSAIFNTLAVQGIVGLLLYLGLFLVPIYSLWKGFKMKTTDVHVFAFGLAFLVAHFIHNSFVFENPTSYLYFFFFLAFINNQVYKKQEIKTASKPISYGFTITLFLLVLLLIYSTNINPSRANKTNLQVIRGVYAQEDIVELYEKAATIPTPHVDDIRNDFARTTSQVLPNYFNAQKARVGLKIFDLAYSELDKNLVLHPDDIRVHILKSQLAFLGGQINQDKEFYREAETLLTQALEKSPKRQQLQFMLAVAKIELGKSDEAIVLLRQAIENAPKVGEGWWRLGLLYKNQGRVDEAVDLIQQSQSFGVKYNQTGQQAIAEIMRAVEESDTN